MFPQNSKDVNQTGANELHRFPGENAVCVVGYVTAGRSPVNNPFRVRADVAESVVVRHDVVPKLLLVFRRGVEIELPARDIEIYSLEGAALSDNEYSLEVYCSKGTYIRSLCRDIGDKLGCGGVMSSLRRTQSGTFDLSRSHTFEELEAMEYEERIGLLCDIESLFADCPEVRLPDFFAHLAHSGAHIYQKKIGAAYDDGQKIRLADKQGFFALGQATRDGEGAPVIKPIKQFVI